MKLFRVTFRVRPATNHPLYWDWQFGLLSIWLFALSDDEAAEHAEKIINELPYETVGDWFKAAPAEEYPTESEKMAAIARDADYSGFALFLQAAATGDVEPENFED